MEVDYNNHCYGGKVKACPFYDSWINFHDIPYWRSVGKKEDVDLQVANFFSSNPEPDVKIFRCLEQVLTELDKFIPDKLKPLSDIGAVKCLPSDTSPGFPYTVTDPGSRKGVLRDSILEDYRSIKVQRNSKFNEPCSAGIRLALTHKPKNKPRLVWVYPASIQVSEAKYFIPIYSQLYSCRYFAWDFSFLRGEISELERFMKGSSIDYGTDVSNFDATVPTRMVKSIFNWVKTKYYMTKEQIWEFEAVVDYFINTPLWYKNKIHFKRQGVPSGSFFTQFIDSIVNLAYQVYIFNVATDFKLDFFREISFLRVLGDDSIVSFRNITFEYSDFIRGVRSLQDFNVVIHPEKGYYHSYRIKFGTCEFLGFEMPTIHTPLRAPILLKDPMLVLAQCVFPEQEEKHAGISLARLIGIKWSCGDSLECHDVVDYFHSLFEVRHAHVKPTDLPVEFKHLFQFVFGRIKIPVENYPSTEEVIKRYRMANDPFMNKLRLYSHKGYTEWCYLMWRPMSFAEIRASTVNEKHEVVEYQNREKESDISVSSKTTSASVSLTLS